MTNAAVTARAGNTHASIGVRKPVLTAALLSAAMTVVLVIRDTNDGPAWRVSLVVSILVAFAAWLVFGVAVQRALAKHSAAATARRSLTLGVLTVLSIALFWSAIPPILAIGTFVLAADARNQSGHPPWPAALGAGLAGLGLVAGLTLTVVG